VSVFVCFAVSPVSSAKSALLPMTVHADVIQAAKLILAMCELKSEVNFRFEARRCSGGEQRGEVSPTGI
jgi:hypothetical protein